MKDGKTTAWRPLLALATLAWLALAAACGGGPLVRVVEPGGRIPGGEAALSGLRQGEDEGEAALRGAKRYAVEDYRRLFGDEAASDYRVGSSDSLTVTVFDEPSLSLAAARLDADGSINMPLIGRVEVLGRTVREIEETIIHSLKTGRILKNPQVTVLVTAYESRQVHVLGAVNKPGLYPLRGGETVLDMVAKAGGIYFGQAGNLLTVLRDAPRQMAAGEVPPADVPARVAIDIGLHDLLYANTKACNIPVSAGDALFIHWPEKVYVMGEVNRPGEYILKGQRLTLVEALGMAGGFTRVADQNVVRVMRVEQGREKIFEVRAREIMDKGLRSHDVLLLPGDIILVPESFF